MDYKESSSTNKTDKCGGGDVTEWVYFSVLSSPPHPWAKGAGMSPAKLLSSRSSQWHGNQPDKHACHTTRVPADTSREALQGRKKLQRGKAPFAESREMSCE